MSDNNPWAEGSPMYQEYQQKLKESELRTQTYKEQEAQFAMRERELRLKMKNSTWLRRALYDVEEVEDLMAVGAWTILTCGGFLLVCGGLAILGVQI